MSSTANSGPVLVVGNNTLDRVFVLSDGLEKGSKASARSARLVPGGQAANVAYTLAVLGCLTRFVGCFGSDLGGRKSRQSLLDVGVDLNASKAIASAHHEAVVLVDEASGERTIVMHKPEPLRVTALQVAAAWSDDVALVYLDNHEQEASLEAGSRARLQGVPVLSDVEVADDHAEQILPLTSILIAPAPVIVALAGVGTAEAALADLVARGPEIVVATLGEDGALVLQRHHGSFIVPAVPCRMVDSTGAGDAFHAGFAAAWLRGHPLRGALNMAARFASAKCEHSGPRIPVEQLQALSKRWLKTS